VNSEKMLPVINETVGIDSVESINLTCCPVTLNPLEPDMMMNAQEYDAVTGQLLAELSVHTYGPILFDDREVVEVHRSFSKGGEVLKKEIHWIGRHNSAIECRLRENRHITSSLTDISEEQNGVESMSSIFPEILEMDYTAERQIRYQQGNYTGIEIFNDRLTGNIQLDIDGKNWNCVCLETLRNGTEKLLLKIYISIDTGKVVMVRKFQADTEKSIQLIEWKK